MKDLLIIAGVGFLVYHYMSTKSTMQSNPSVDTAGTTVLSSVAASVPLPGTATTGTTGSSGVPVAGSVGGNPSVSPGDYGGPASLGSDLATRSGNSGVVAPSAITHAIDRADYVNPFNRSINSRMEM